ncbi:MAG: malate dehydrogenase [Marinilabiliales bacterium]|nr:MAG: malate dehydrogenase [Marinilabiliales bacterium]
MPGKFTVEDLHSIVYRIFHKAGCRPTDADSIAQVLIAAELRGIPSHGIVRIKDYIGLYQKGRMNMQPEIRIVHETPSTATIDGDNGPGIVVAMEAMKTAISKAETAGSGWVAVRNSNHFGIAGFYSLMAAQKDMIGIASTNANALVAPTFSIDRMLGTNPIAFAIPGKEEKPFVADFATTPIARGKLEIMEKQGKTAPEGFIQDAEGNVSTDPSVLKRGGAILPLGGDYEHSSYKGYCMSAMVDILSAVIPGANFGPFVPPQVAYLEPKAESPGEGLGHFFGAMRLDAFRPADEIKSYLDLWIRTFRNAKAADEQTPVLIPGDPEYAKENELKENGISIIPQVWDELIKCADSLGLDLNQK